MRTPESRLRSLNRRFPVDLVLWSATAVAVLFLATGCATGVTGPRRGLAALEAPVPEDAAEDAAELRSPASSLELEVSGKQAALKPAWRALRALARELGRRNGDPGYREDFARREIRFSLEDDDHYLEFLDGKRDEHATRVISLRVVRPRGGSDREVVVEAKVIGEVRRRAEADGDAAGRRVPARSTVSRQRFRDHDSEEELLDRVASLLEEPDFSAKK